MGKKTIVEHVEDRKKDIEIRETEVVEYRSQTSFVRDRANVLIIKTAEDMEKASELLTQVKQVAKAITERKESITRPLMAGLSEARNLFKPFEVDYIEAEKTIKAKMLAYSIDEEERIEKEKSKVEGRLERGTIRQDTAISKMEAIGDAPTSYGKTSLRTVTKVRVVDESLIPREYLVPDMGKITEAVMKQKLTIAGVETYEEKSIVGSTR